MTLPAPRYATRLDPAAVHFAGRVAVSARALGEPLIPWQYTAAQLITAVDPRDPCRWRYPLVVITVPRQSGKTTALRAVHLDRLLMPLPDQLPTKPITIWTTAQTGKDARRRFGDLADRIELSPQLGKLFARRRSVGSEHLAIGRTALAPFAPVASALHGETSPFVSVDEAWAFDEAHAAALLAAITPTQQNFPGAQLIVISTAGTRESAWLWSLVKAGRASIADPAARMAYLEYSADPRYALEASDPLALDPLDPAALAFHPSIGAGPGLPETARDVTDLYAKAGGIDNIRRGFLNLWPADMDTASLRSLEAFDRAAALEPPAQTGALTMALDVAADRSGAAIYAAYSTPFGRRVELVESAAGVAWLAHTTALAGRSRAWHDPAGYTGAAAADLHAQPVGAGDLAAATADFLAGIADGTISVDLVPELRDQFESAVTRPSGGGFVFDPDRSPGPIDHLRAAALACYKARQSVPLIGW